MAEKKDDSHNSLFLENARAKANIFCAISMIMLGAGILLHLAFVRIGLFDYEYLPIEEAFFTTAAFVYLIPAIAFFFLKKSQEKQRYILLGSIITASSIAYTIIAKDGGVFLLFPMFVAGMYFSRRTCTRSYIALLLSTIIGSFLFFYIDIHFLHYYDVEWDVQIIIVKYLMPEFCYLTVVYLYSIYTMNSGKKFIRMLLDSAEKNARKNAEIETCVQVQQSALPSFTEIAPNGELSVSAGLEPALEAAGDFYDFFLTKDGHIAALVADVSDKGLGAALYSMSVRNTIRAHYQYLDRPEDVCTQANEMLCDTSDQEFVTLFLADIELSTGRGSFVNAGHTVPFILRADGTTCMLEAEPQVFMGAFHGIRYGSTVFSLEPGDTLCMYTDGFTEAENPGSEQYGAERMMQCAGAHIGASPDGLKAALIEDVKRFEDGSVVSDDKTIVLLRRN